MSNVIIMDKNYLNEDALENVISYALRVDNDELNNTSFSVYWDGSGVLVSSPNSSIESFKVVKRLYNRNGGNLLHHIIITIDEKSLSSNEAFSIARNICNNIGFEILSNGFQNITFIHHTVHSTHIHLIINSINYHNGNRISSTGWLGNTIMLYLRKEFYDLTWEYNPIYKKGSFQ